MPGKRWLRYLAAGALCIIGAARGEELRVATASNFAEAAAALAARFENLTGHRVVLSPGSTGKHYAQICHGAPFDLFLAADAERPERLERGGLALPGSRFTYAIGRLVLWSPRDGYVDAEGRVLETGAFRYLAIANPSLAPYGRAARDVLEARGLWERLQGRIARGENIAQALQFVRSGNAELGFVSASQVRPHDRSPAGSRWDVPPELHLPLEQQAVLLRDREAARAFLAYLQGDEALKIIRAYGYDTP